MGFKDANWAYSLDLPMAQKVVLAAICQRTDDRTHTTLVGQETIAGMIGMSVRSVHRAVGVLDDLGIITREQRRGKGGYRTSDAITINAAYTSESHVTDDQVTESHVTESPTSHDTVSDLTRQSVMTIDVNQIDQPDGQSDLMPIEPMSTIEVYLKATRGFDDFWLVWPRKDSKKAAQTAWAKAIKLTDSETIYTAARDYANHPHRVARQFVPYAASWLNGERWADPLPEAPENDRNTMTRGEKNLAFVQQLAAEQAAQARGIAS